MKTSKNGILLITTFEGLRLRPYLCSAGIATIGYGSTFYEDGTTVKMTNKPITKERAMELFKTTLVQYENAVNKLVKLTLTQNQFDALVSFTYNVGIGAFTKSILLKVINTNPNDLINIEKNFLKWNKANKKVITGLTNRRIAEYKLYYTPNESK